MVEAAAWQKHDIGGSGRVLGSTAAARHLRQHCGIGGGSGSGGRAAGSAAAAWEGRDVGCASHVLIFFPFFSVPLQISSVEYHTTYLPGLTQLASYFF
jgi:hypothetical protein